MTPAAGKAPRRAAAWRVALLASLILPVPGGAQQPVAGEMAGRASVACGSGGLSLGVEELGAEGAEATAAVRTDATTRTDTTIAFAVTDRTWRWRNVVAHVSVGATGTEGAPWRVCAGAVAALREAVLTLRGVTGAVRFRFDPSGLASLVQSDSVTPARP